MQTHQKSIYFFLILLFIIFAKCMGAHADTDTNTDIENCLTHVCNYEDPVSRYVHFPFLIRNDSIPRSCGYPGFDLFCDGADRLIIDLPNSGVFSVQAIDYVKKELWLNDPNNCLPRRLLSHNFSSSFGNSPFVPIQEQVYWVYNCSSDYFEAFSYMKPIGCLSGPSYGVVATSSDLISNVTSMFCGKIGSIRVPIGLSRPEERYYSDLGTDFPLTWVQPECGDCVQRGGLCGFKSHSSLEVECFNLPPHRLPRNAIIAIALALAAPLALLVFCIIYFVVSCIRSARRRVNQATIVFTPHPQTIANGLDRSTIESYPKVVLGESRRLPKPDDKSCPICLGEYLAKETLRTLPHCEHCFHAECIDEWLHLNSSCPVCRNSPSCVTENT